MYLFTILYYQKKKKKTLSTRQTRHHTIPIGISIKRGRSYLTRQNDRPRVKVCEKKNRPLDCELLDKAPVLCSEDTSVGESCLGRAACHITHSEKRDSLLRRFLLFQCYFWTIFFCLVEVFLYCFEKIFLELVISRGFWRLDLLNSQGISFVK